MKAVFLDRDGTLVRMFPQDGLPPRGPRTIDEIEYLPDVKEGCRFLRRGGYKLVCVSNQPDISRGLVTAHSVRLVNDEIMYSIPLDAVYTCSHQDGDGCGCRKPKPGLLYAAAYECNLQIDGAAMIGDNDRDEQAAAAAGVRFVRTDGTNFLECVKWILGNCE